MKSLQEDNIVKTQLSVQSFPFLRIANIVLFPWYHFGAILDYYGSGEFWQEETNKQKGGGLPYWHWGP